MKEVEVFFDYVCPFCNEGIWQFLEVLPEYSDVKVIWRPCESHPRPEFACVHSDLAIQTFFCLQEQGGDLVQYHQKIFDACFQEKRRIDDIDMLSITAAECGANEEEVRAALKENKYAGKVEDANRYAWEEKGLFAVPSYISGNKQALSKDGRLVPIQKVIELLK